MSKSCANCNAEILEGADMCENCGMPVSEAVSPREAPPQKVSTETPLTPPLAEQGAPERRSQLEQREQLPPSRPTLSDSGPAQVPHGGRQHRGLARWLVRLAGLVGTAAAGLVGMTFWRRGGVDAREQGATGDSATPQSGMGVTEADVQDPDLSEQGEATPDLVDEVSTTAPPPVTPPPDAAGTPPVSEPVGESASPPMDTPPIPLPLDAVDTPPSPEAPLVTEPPGGVAPPPLEEPPVLEPPAGVAPPPEGFLPEEPLQEEPLQEEPLQEEPLQEGPLPEGLPAEGLPAEWPPVEEPAMLEPSAPTLDPNLTDPTAPGPTLDMGLVVQIQQNMRLIVAINRNPDIASTLAQDPTQLAQIEQNLGLAEQRFMEPGGVAGPAAAAGLDVVQPDIPEPGPPDQDLDAQPNP